MNKNNNTYVCGDLHGTLEINKLSKKRWPEQKKFDGSEVLIQVGDFGLIWDLTPTNEEKYWLDWLSDKPFTTVFIDGNHENFDRLYKFPIEEKFGNPVHVIRDNIFHLNRGYLYKIYNKNFFCFGGAQSHDMIYRTEKISWWREELPTFKEMNRGIETIINNKNNIDYVITHTIPSNILIKCFLKNNYKINLLTEYFQNLINTYKFNYTHWYAGHFHQDIIVNDKFTILYNNIVKLK